MVFLGNGKIFTDYFFVGKIEVEKRNERNEKKSGKQAENDEARNSNTFL